MAIGRKSIVSYHEVSNTQNFNKPHRILVQANKNHGICDVLLIPDFGENVTTPPVRIPEVLSICQGQQYDDSEVIDHVLNVISEVLNPKSE